MKILATQNIFMPLSFLLLSIVSSCNKQIQNDRPSTSISGEGAYMSNNTAISSVTSIYTNISKAGQASILSSSTYLGLAADELSLFPGTNNNTYVYYYTNSYNPSNLASTTNFWNQLYPIVYNTNAAIEGLNGNNSISSDVKKQLLGEVKFIRAYCYYYLTVLYGDVPLVLSTDYTINASIKKTNSSDVISQIINDLKEAELLLSEGFLDGTLQKTTTERVRPTKWAAMALLARVYLHSQKWADAETESSKVIASTSNFSLDSSGTAFLKNRPEAIWQLQSVTTGQNSYDGRLFIIPSTGPNTGSYPLLLSDYLLNSFEMNDKRKVNWTSSVSSGGKIYYYPYKYKKAFDATILTAAQLTEHQTMLRIAEQYLIRAEARAQQNKLSEAAQDLNLIRKRAWLGATLASTNTEILNAIYHERQVELFTEGGLRWIDLKRTNTIDSVLGAPLNITQKKGGTWNSGYALMPISQTEILSNPSLKQNAAYN